MNLGEILDLVRNSLFIGYGERKVKFKRKHLEIIYEQVFDFAEEIKKKEEEGLIRDYFIKLLADKGINKFQNKPIEDYLSMIDDFASPERVTEFIIPTYFQAIINHSDELNHYGPRNDKAAIYLLIRDFCPELTGYINKQFKKNQK